MGQTIHLKLKANGKEIKGESTQKSHGRENTIECHSVRASANAQLNPSTGLATGRRTYSPIAVSRIMDAASPLILQALCQNEKIEATFEFYRPSPTGDGTTEKYYTIDVKNGRIESVSQADASGGGDPQ